MFVSVVIPAFNAEAWIVEALDSVLCQTCRDFEIIVVDDGSLDGTAQLAEARLKRAGISYRIERQENSGPGAARNRGWRMARGELVQMLDADDVLHPHKLQVQTECARRFPSAVIYSNWGRLTNIAGEWLADASRRPQLDRRPAVDLIDDRNFVHLGAQLLPVEWLRRVGGFDESLAQGEDVDLDIRIALAGASFRKAGSDGALFWYRDRPESLSKSDPGAFASGCVRNARLVASHIGTLEPEDVEIVAKACFGAARSLARHDWPRFLESVGELERLRPGFVPSSPAMLSLLSAAIGYRDAERCAVWYGRAKAQVGRWHRAARALLPGSR